MLLVDHDQGEVADRREHRRARPDADARLTLAQAQPLVAALARRQGGVQDRDPVAEPGPEPGHRLRREADLGDEDDRPPPPRQRRLDSGEVDLGLARPGDPVDQQLPRRPGLSVERGDDRVDRGALLRQQRRRRGGCRAHPCVPRAPADRGAAGDDQPALLEPAQHLAIGADGGVELAGGHLPRPQRLERRPLARAEPAPGGESLLAGGRDLGPQLGPRPDTGAVGADPGRQHQLQPARGGRAVLAGDPEPERDELGGRAGLERFERLGEPLRRQLGVLGEGDDDPEGALTAEGDTDDAADVEPLHRLRQPVVERPPQGAGGRQRLDLGDRHPTHGMEDRGRPPARICSGSVSEQASISDSSRRERTRSQGV